MKKSILTAIFGIVTTVVFAQSKPTYSKVVVVPLQDYNQLMQVVIDYKDVIIYNPNLTADFKVQSQQSINAYLKELPNRVKLDSVNVEPKPVKK